MTKWMEKWMKMSKKMSIRGLALGAASLLWFASASLHAQAWPQKPIRIIVPYTVGGASDITARLLADRMSVKFGQAVTVENRAGASGTIGTDAVAKAAPDGYTLAFVASSHVVNKALFPALPYDPIKSFAPISQTANVQLVMVVPATPTPHFVVAHAQFLLADFETGVYRPAHSTRANQPLLRHIRWGIAQVGLQVTVGHASAQHQPDGWARQSVAHRHHPQEGKLSNLGSLAAFLNDLLLPLIGGQGRADERVEQLSVACGHGPAPLAAGGNPTPSASGRTPS